MASICLFSSSELMASICLFSSSELMASICPLFSSELMASICPFSSSELMASICPFSSSELMASYPLLQAISQTKLKAFSLGRTNPVKKSSPFVKKKEEREQRRKVCLSVCTFVCFYLSVCLYGVVLQAHKQGGVLSRREGQSDLSQQT